MSTSSRRTRAGVALGLGAGLLLAGAVPATATPPAPLTGHGDAAESADQIEAAVDAMSIDELIGQMTWTRVYGNSADDTSMAAENQQYYGVDTPAEVIEKYDLGGVLYFAWSNTIIEDDPVGAAELSNGLQAVSTGEDASGIPLAVTIDQEGGIVARMTEPSTVLPGNMALGATFDTDLAYAQGQVLGSELAAVGVNVDFAPVLDVNTNPDNPVIGVRSMGADPSAVADLGLAQVEGMQSEGIGATAKHFPGHGDTEVDSHSGLPIITYDQETLDQHLVPFQAAIEGGIDMIMTAHIIVEAIDPEMPGTLSHEVLTGLLREEMGFDGLITTDSLGMGALKDIPGHPLDDGDIAALAIEAGSDILLNSPDVDAAFEGVRAAIEAGDLTRERLEESVTRILEWKVERGVWDGDPRVPVEDVMDTVGNDEHLATATEIGDRAVTMVRNDDDVLPLDADADSVLMVGAGSAWPERMGPILVERGFEVTEDYENGASPSAEYRERAVAAAAEHDAVVFASNNADEAQQEMVAALAETDTPVVVVATRNPYDANVLPGADAVLNIYGWFEPNFHGAVAAVAGDLNPTGALPVDVPTADGSEALYPIGFGLHYPVTPAEPEFTDRPGRGRDGYTIPESQGVQYLVNGEATEPGTYRAHQSRDVTVASQALEGWEIAEDATSEWSVCFTTGRPGHGGGDPCERGGRH